MKNKNKISELISYIVIIALVIALKIFVVTPIKVNGTSMEPTLKQSDIMILNKINYRFNDIKRFDIVVIDVKDDYIIKRVIGLPGETVEYKNNILYVNGKEIKEEFTHTNTDDFNITEIDIEKIPDKMYFVVGDNRIDSLDSRIIGLITEEQIMGRSKNVLFPFNRFGSVK